MPDRMSWNDYFMGIALVSSCRSNDGITKVGAVIAGPNRNVVGVGYNGMALKVPDSKERWEKDEKAKWVCHAERNAIYFSSGSVRGCDLYCTEMPCTDCAKSIIQAGIKKVFYLSDKRREKETTKQALELFCLADVDITHIDQKKIDMIKTINVSFEDAKCVVNFTEANSDVTRATD